MTARIEVEPGSDGVRIAVLGRLDEPAARELLQVCAGHTAVTIDLEDMIAADKFAIESLKELRGKGALLTRASPYLALLLNTPSRRTPVVATDSREEDE